MFNSRERASLEIVQGTVEDRLSKAGFTPVTTPTGDGDSAVLYWKSYSNNSENFSGFESSLQNVRKNIENANLPPMVKTSASHVMGVLANRHNSPLAAFQTALGSIIQEDSSVAKALINAGIQRAFHPIIGDNAELLGNKGQKLFYDRKRALESGGQQFNKPQLERLCGKIMIEASAKMITELPLDSNPRLSPTTKRFLSVLAAASDEDLRQGLVLGLPEEFADTQNAVAFEISIIAAQFAKRSGKTLMLEDSNSKGGLSKACAKLNSFGSEYDIKILLVPAALLDEAFHTQSRLDVIPLEERPSMAAVLGGVDTPSDEKSPMSCFFADAGIYFPKN